MRRLERILLLIGIGCLALWGIYTVQRYLHQARLERALEREIYEARPRPAPEAPKAPAAPSPAPRRRLKEGDLVGRLEIPRLNLSVIVMEGTSSKTLRLGAGRIAGTAFPWTEGNVGIAAHRDTFFRPLENVRESDVIKLTTPDGTSEYRVKWKRVVKPTDVHVLNKTSTDTLTLVTCYPFRWVGPAPKRFIVQATLQTDRAGAN